MVISLSSSPSLSIPAVQQVVIDRYFETINAGNFEQTAQLFAQAGELYPPFEEAIAGREAIHRYLHQEAQGLRCEPQQGAAFSSGDSLTQVQIQGRVHTPLFSVNVAWEFLLNDLAEILSVQVKLLASLEELMNLRR